jgi:hypothetical protein
MEKYTAVIVEPRIHPAWKLVLNNFFTNLDERWDFIIVCGLKNKDYVVDLIENNFQNHKHRITIHQINIDDFYNNLNYSNFMLDTTIYEIIPTEVFLIFQLDALISTKYKDLIYDFIKYDYVGAPWGLHKSVGNGGLSLRRKSVVLDVIKNHDSYFYDNNNKRVRHNEDGFFSTFITNKPSYEEAKLFSVETAFSDKSFGIHRCFSYLPPDEVEKIGEYVPELFELINLHK